MAYTYFYKAVDGQGKDRSGNIEGINEKEVSSQLREQGLYVTEIRLSDNLEDPFARKLRLDWLRPNYHARIKSNDLSTFFRQMSLMLQSGSTILESLEINNRLVEKRKLSQSIKRIENYISEGKKLSDSMVEEKKIFGDFLPKMIESGEQSGELDQVMERLAEDLERQSEMKRALKAAMIYPTILIIVTVAVILYLLISIIPKFAEFLGRQGTSLPWTTQLMLDVSSYMQDNGLYLGIAIGSFVMSILVFYTTDTGEKLIDKILIRMPIIGKNIIAGTMAQTGWSMAIQLKSGMTILDAINASKQLVKNRAFHAAFTTAANRITEGGTLTSSFDQPIIPLMMRHMITVGEKTGELDSVMMHMAHFYQIELRARIKLMGEMIQPVLTVVIGATIGFVYLSFFSAMLKVSTGGQ